MTGLDLRPIEFIDSETNTAADVNEKLDGGAPTGWILVAAIAVVGGLWFLASSTTGPGSDSVALPLVARTSTQTALTEPPRVITTLVEIVTPVDPATTWPDPPRDHDPHVIGYPGHGIQLLGRESNLTLVYVNSLRRPTVVDLDDGTIHELDIATSRERDTFAVELGDVVSIDGSSANLDTASDRAIQFNVHRETDIDNLASATILADLVGPHLCLLLDGCVGLGWMSTEFANEGDLAQLADSETHPEIAKLVLGDWATTRRRFLVVELESGDTFELPAPLGTTFWIVHQP